MLDRGTQFAPIQVSDAHVVVVVGRFQDRPPFILDLLFTSVNQNLRALLNLGFFGMFADEFVEATDGFFELLGVHQLDSSFVSLDGAGKMPGGRTFRTCTT